MSDALLLELADVSVLYAAEPHPIRAVDRVSLRVAPGETLALVGESGCGKSTVARAVMGLVRPTSGSIRYRGHPLSPLGDRARRRFLTKIQMIFQDPDASLNPRFTIGSSIAEPIEINGPRLARAEMSDRISSLMNSVGLHPELGSRYPHELSGGQRQRVCIARALAVRPELLVCDEAVSALDVSVQAQILNLLVELRETFGLSYLFITHDLRVVRHLSNRVAVMYLGQLVEVGSTEGVFERPAHPYTRGLLSAVPSLRARPGARASLRVRGDVPSPADPPTGCHFHTRCPHAFDRCFREEPHFYQLGGGASSRCFLNETADRNPIPGR